MITKQNIRFILAHREKLSRLIYILGSHGCTYWDDVKGEFAKSKDLLDFVTLGLDGLTMRDVKQVLEVI